MADVRFARRAARIGRAAGLPQACQQIMSGPSLLFRNLHEDKTVSTKKVTMDSKG